MFKIIIIFVGHGTWEFLSDYDQLHAARYSFYITCFLPTMVFFNCTQLESYHILTSDKVIFYIHFPETKVQKNLQEIFYQFQQQIFFFQFYLLLYLIYQFIDTKVYHFFNNLNLFYFEITFQHVMQLEYYWLYYQIYLLNLIGQQFVVGAQIIISMKACTNSLLYLFIIICIKTITYIIIFIYFCQLTINLINNITNNIFDNRLIQQFFVFNNNASELLLSRRLIRIQNYNRQHIIPPLTMNNHTDYIQIANQLHNLTLYNQLYEQMNKFPVLQQIFLNQCQKSQTLLFAACQILSKKLINRQLLISADDIDNNKKFILFKISSKLYQFILTSNNTLPNHIIRSCINTISLCINASIYSTTGFDEGFVNYMRIIVPDFKPNQLFIHPHQIALSFVQPSPTNLDFHHQYAIMIFSSLLDYIINSTYSQNYYYFRRNLYAFKNQYLVYLLNYSIFCIKSVFKTTIGQFHGSVLPVFQSIRPALKLFQTVVTYPLSVTVHEAEVEDQIHQNISGLQTQIYFPSCFRNLFCDTGLLMDIIGYYSKLNFQAPTLQLVRQDLYSLIRIIGRVLSTSQYVFASQQQKKAFRSISIEFITTILKQNKFFDTYLILCITKINVKFMSIQNDDQMFEGKRQYFKALALFICNGVTKSEGKIQDGDKHPYRQLFQVLNAFINITANTILDHESKNCAQEALNILFTKRMVNNEQNMRLMKEFGYNNSQQIDCFDQIFARIPQIFKINLVVNLATLHELNLSALNSESLTFWLHLTALLLPQHDTSIQQTQLILKFLDAAIQARSIASLHYMQTLVQQVLYEVKDGISTTYLWKFIEQSKQISFQQFLSYIIQYSMKILIIPNYALIQHCLQLFKSMFTKLCKYRHKSFNKYFQIIESVCRQIDKTMLVKPQYIKLRINFFSIISIIWVNEGQISFVYRILNNIRSSLGQHPDYIHFLRYLTDITGLLQPVQSSQVYKLLLQLVLVDMQKVLPFYLGTLEKISAAFSQQIFLKTFVKFIYTIVNDNGFRLTNDSHTQLPFQIEQTFSPYLLQVIKYDYPVKTVQTWLKFIKLNPLGKLLPLQKSFKQKNSPHYKSLIREYFQNLHRLQNIQQFYTIYTYIDDNIDLMVDWWQQIMIRGYKPNINVRDVVNARLCVNSRQKQHFAKLLFRIAKYDQNYWRIQCDATTESKYADWFVANYR